MSNSLRLRNGSVITITGAKSTHVQKIEEIAAGVDQYKLYEIKLGD